MMQVFGCDHTKENIRLQLQWKGLALMYETKNFLSRPSWIPILSLSIVEYLKNVAKVWNLGAEKQQWLLVFRVVIWHKWLLKYVECYKQE
jgi:hypothetical protein